MHSIFWSSLPWSLCMWSKIRFPQQLGCALTCTKSMSPRFPVLISQGFPKLLPCNLQFILSCFIMFYHRVHSSKARVESSRFVVSSALHGGALLRLKMQLSIVPKQKLHWTMSLFAWTVALFTSDSLIRLDPVGRDPQRSSSWRRRGSGAILWARKFPPRRSPHSRGRVRRRHHGLAKICKLRLGRENQRAFRTRYGWCPEAVNRKVWPSKVHSRTVCTKSCKRRGFTRIKSTATRTLAFHFCSATEAPKMRT